MLTVPSLLSLSLALVPLALSGRAHASERHFAFTREATVVQSGRAELDPSTTAQLGREHYYSALEAELGVRFGLVPNLEGTLAWNLRERTEDVADEDSGAETRQTRSSLTGAAAAFQYKLSDPVADSIGFALRVEGRYGPDEADAGGTIVLGKQSGRLLFTANLSGAQSFDFASGETETEQRVELDLGIGYFFTPNLVAGVEALTLTAIDRGEAESSRIYAGPSLAFTADHYWLALGVAPQIFAPKSADDGDRDLTRGEYVRARIVFGLAL